MKFAIFSDIHANIRAWEAVHADMRAQGADVLLCLGDVVGYGPLPQQVVDSIRAATSNFVLGNHDAVVAGRLDPSVFNDNARAIIEWTRKQLNEETLRFFSQVPLDMEGNDILLVHAEVASPGSFGYLDTLQASIPSFESTRKTLTFVGHTHHPKIYVKDALGKFREQPPNGFRIDPGNQYIVNVGSVGEPRTPDVRASYCLYDDEQKTVTFRKVPFDVEAYRKDLALVKLDIHPYFLQVVDYGALETSVMDEEAMKMAPKVAVQPLTTQRCKLVVSGPNPCQHLRSAAMPQPNRLTNEPEKSLKILSFILVGLIVITAVLGGFLLKSLREKGAPNSGIAPGSTPRDEKAHQKIASQSISEMERINNRGVQEEVEALSEAREEPSQRASQKGIRPLKPVLLGNRTTLFYRLVNSGRLKNPTMWAYSIGEEEAAWNAQDFDAHSEWKVGEAGFGKKKHKDIHTPFTAPRIFLRSEFLLPEDVSTDRTAFLVRHQGDCLVYINGAKAYHRAESNSGKEREFISEAVADKMRPGRNVIAASVEHSGGEAIFDIEMRVFTKLPGETTSEEVPVASEATIVLSEGINGYAGTEDTTVISNLKEPESKEFGSEKMIIVGRDSADSPRIHRGLIRFNFENLDLPSDAEIGEGKLILQTLEKEGSFDGVLEMCLVGMKNAGWGEGITNWEYQNKDARKAWFGGKGLGTEKNAGFHTKSPYAVAGKLSEDGQQITFSIDQSMLIRMISSPQYNFGFLLRFQDESTQGSSLLKLGSRESDEKHRPRLVISLVKGK